MKRNKKKCGGGRDVKRILEINGKGKERKKKKNGD